MPQPASVYLELRDAITRVVPGEHGMAPTPELPHVWGVMIDVGLPAGPVTVVAIADGTTSLYLGNGGATVGVGALPPVAALAQELLLAVEAAGRASPVFAPTWQFPLPDPGRVGVLVLSYQGMLAARAGMAELTSDGHPLGAVWAATGALVGAIEAVGAGTTPS